MTGEIPGFVPPSTDECIPGSGVYWTDSTTGTPTKCLSCGAPDPTDHVPSVEAGQIRLRCPPTGPRANETDKARRHRIELNKRREGLAEKFAIAMISCVPLTDATEESQAAQRLLIRDLFVTAFMAADAFDKEALRWWKK